MWNIATGETSQAITHFHFFDMSTFCVQSNWPFLQLHMPAISQTPDWWSKYKKTENLIFLYLSWEVVPWLHKIQCIGWAKVGSMALALFSKIAQQCRRYDINCSFHQIINQHQRYCKYIIFLSKCKGRYRCFKSKLNCLSIFTFHNHTERTISGLFLHFGPGTIQVQDL